MEEPEDLCLVVGEEWEEEIVDEGGLELDDLGLEDVEGEDREVRSSHAWLCVEKNLLIWEQVNTS